MAMSGLDGQWDKGLWSGGAMPPADGDMDIAQRIEKQLS